MLNGEEGKYLEVDGMKFYYKALGKGFPTIILLGWSADVDSFPYSHVLSSYNKYLQKYRLIFLQLSNFYRSTMTKKVTTLNQYAFELNQIIEVFNFNKVNLIGHSAGGRIATCYTMKYPEKVNKLVLLNSAGLKHKEATEDELEEAHLRFKRLDIEEDQRKKDILKETFRKIYNTDLTENLKNIHSPTLIIWGKKDYIINVSKAFTFNKHLKNSQLMIYPNLGHNTIYIPEVFARIFEFLK